MHAPSPWLGSGAAAATICCMLFAAQHAASSPLRSSSHLGDLGLSDHTDLIAQASSSSNKFRSLLEFQTKAPGIDVLRQLATAMDPELMQYAPKLGSFDKKYKNPCWRMDDSELRCIPYFYVGGSFQAGAQDMFGKLMMHPDIVTTEATRWQFWGEEGKTFMRYLEMNQKGIKELSVKPEERILVDASMSTFAFYWSANLRAHQGFQRTIVPCFHNCSMSTRGNEEDRAECLKSVCYPMAHANDRKATEALGLDYDLKHLPALIAALYGSERVPKMIFMLRDPVERLHSAYWTHPHYKGKYGDSPEGFLAYVTEQIDALRLCSVTERRNSERDCVLYFETLGLIEEQLFFHADQIIRGMYSIFVEVWLRHFPRDNIMFIRSEEYFADDMATLRKVITFLGLPAPSDRFIASVKAKAKPHSQSAGKHMDPDAERLLGSFYKPYNEKLAVLLGDDAVLDWNKKHGV